jgi:hypothetical protein
VFDKLRLKPGDRLLDVGCGWGGMVWCAARWGVEAIGVTLSAAQASWASKAVAEEGLIEPSCRHDGAIHRPLRLPRRRTHRIGPGYHRDAERRLRGWTRSAVVGSAVDSGCHGEPKDWRGRR